MSRLKIAGVLSLLFVLRATSLMGASYSLVDMGLFSPCAMNSNGDVVGFTSSDGTLRAAVFCFANKTLTPIWNFGELHSQATGINDVGDITGYSEQPDGTYHAFLYSQGNMHDLGTMGHASSFAYGINNKGQVVGECSDGAESRFPFLYGATGMIDPISPGISGSAHSINDAGEIAGTILNAENHLRAAIFRDGEAIQLGTLGTDNGAMSINSKGQVTGRASWSDGQNHPFFYDGIQMLDIDGVDFLGLGYSINDKGQIVGIHGDGAFLYSDGQLTNLNSLIDPNPNIFFSEAVAINDSGKIVACNFNGEAYLLIPIPEPTSLAMLGTFFGILFALVCSQERQEKN